jgi:hypothetical protein
MLPVAEEPAVSALMPVEAPAPGAAPLVPGEPLPDRPAELPEAVPAAAVLSLGCPVTASRQWVAAEMMLPSAALPRSLEPDTAPRLLSELAPGAELAPKSCAAAAKMPPPAKAVANNKTRQHCCSAEYPGGGTHGRV